MSTAGMPGVSRAASAGDPAVRLRLGVLGTVAAWRDGVPVKLGALRRKALLGLLILQPDCVVSVDSVTGALWHGEPPPTAGAMIQSYVSRLRAALDPGRDGRRTDCLVETVDGGYLLRSGHVAVDLVEWRRLAGLARSAIRTGDVENACSLFERALALWRGEVAADVPLLRGHPVVVGVEQEHAAVVVEYARAASARGRHDRVLPHLLSLVDRAPLDERAHACLMIALAGTGQQGTALELFERLRRRLDEQLGVLPAEVLTEAHARVLRHELVTVPVPAPAGNGALCQLPPAVTDFTGREAETGRLVEWLADGGRGGVPVVVISGPPGAGKTALGLHAAHVVRKRFADGQLWAGLDGGSGRPRDPAEVLAEWLRALGVHGSAIPETVAERAAMFRSRLADRRVLVVADDAASAAQVMPLLPGTAGCAVIVTSRRQLGDVPGARLLPLGPLSVGEAEGLLVRIAGAERVAAEAEAAGELVAACGRLPLAVRIAGAKLAARPSVSVAALAGMVARERGRLDVLRAGDLSVRASIASGYQSLSEPARRAFCLLGVLGSCDVAEWVIAALLGGADGSEVVEELVDRSMLTVTGTDDTGRTRYRLHDLLRDYAVEQAGGGPDVQAAVRRAQDGWLQLASLAMARLPSEAFFPRWDSPIGVQILPDHVSRELTADPVTWFRAERLNLLTVTEQACADNRYHFAISLAVCQAEEQERLDRYQDTQRIWQAILSAAAQDANNKAIAKARLRLAGALEERGYSAKALVLLEECVPAFEQDGDDRDLAFALYWRGITQWSLNRYRAARDDAERGVALGRGIGDQYAELANLRSLGLALGALGEHAEGIGACERALAIANDLPGSAPVSYALHNLAFCCAMAGEHKRAIEVASRRLELSRLRTDPYGEALSLAVLGDAYSGLGRHKDAVRAYSSALPAFMDLGIRRHQAVCLYKLGCAYRVLERYTDAAPLLHASLELFHHLQLPVYERRARQALQTGTQHVTA